MASDRRLLDIPLRDRILPPGLLGPVTALDWSAVWLYRVALLLLAPSVLLLAGLASSLPVLIAATIVAGGALVAGRANAVEDGIGVKGLGTIYVLGFLVA